VRVKANYGTGFRAPSFNELFWPADPVWGGGGNPDLEPEKTRSWEAGIEKDLLNRRMMLKLTYFHQKYRNLISGWPPVNIGKAEARGIETGASMKATDSLLLTAFYTYVDTEDKDTGQRLTRRPIDKLNVTADYSNGPVSLMASYLYAGKAYDDTALRNLSAYSLVNLSGSYVINKKVKLFGRIDNLFDEDYETAGGYNTPGISAFAGVKVSI
jgi:vitamin B12 transporter